MLNNEKARLEVKKKVRRRRLSATQHAISQTPYIPPSKDKSRAKVYLNRITGWIKAHKFILILLLILLVGGFLRLYNLGTESLWLDEISRIEFAEHSPSYIIQEAIGEENQPPLYFFILHFWILLFGSSEIAARFPSVIFGIISVFLIYKIGYKLFSQKIGLISSFLLSVSTFHIFHSQEANPYSLYLFLTLLSFYFFIQILRENRNLNYIGYLLTNILLCFSHLFGFIVIVAQIFYFALFWKKNKQQRRKFAGVQLASMFALIPLVILAIPRLTEIAEGGGGGIAWIPKPSIESIWQTLDAYAGNYFLSNT